VLSLVESLGLRKEMVVIERNEAVVDRDTLHTIEIQEDDIIEILQFVGGG